MKSRTWTVKLYEVTTVLREVTVEADSREAARLTVLAGSNGKSRSPVQGYSTHRSLRRPAKWGPG